MAMHAPCLIGVMMRAQTMAARSGKFLIIQLFGKFELHDTVSTIEMNQLKQKNGFQTQQSNDQMMFEQIA